MHARQSLVRILFDKCIDRRLAKDIEGHEVVTVPEADGRESRMASYWHEPKRNSTPS